MLTDRPPHFRSTGHRRAICPVIAPRVIAERTNALGRKRPAEGPGLVEKRPWPFPLLTPNCSRILAAPRVPNSPRTIVIAIRFGRTTSKKGLRLPWENRQQVVQTTLDLVFVWPCDFQGKEYRKIVAENLGTVASVAEPGSQAVRAGTAGYSPFTPTGSGRPEW